MGTYLAFAHEGTTRKEPRWHRMHRRFDDVEYPGNVLRKGFRLSLWGEGARLQGVTLVLITVTNWFVLVKPHTVWVSPFSIAAWWTPETLAVVLGCFTLVGVFPLCHSARELDKFERRWKEYHYERFEKECVARYERVAVGQKSESGLE